MVRYNMMKWLNALALILANLAPLIGVIFWEWDIFSIILLYWFEIAIIAFWHIVTVLYNPLYGWTNIRYLYNFAYYLVVLLFMYFAMFSTFLLPKKPITANSSMDIIMYYLYTEGLWIPLLLLFMNHGISLARNLANVYKNPDLISAIDSKKSSLAETEIQFTKANKKIKLIEIPWVKKRAELLRKRMIVEELMIEQTAESFLINFGIMTLFVILGFLLNFVMTKFIHKISNYEMVFLILFILSKTLVEISVYLRRINH